MTIRPTKRDLRLARTQPGFDPVKDKNTRRSCLAERPGPQADRAAPAGAAEQRACRALWDRELRVLGRE